MDLDALLPQGSRDPDRFPYAAAGEALPLVSCVLVVGQRERARFARVAVNQFVAQTYPNKQLVVVNGSGMPVTNVPHAEILELAVPSGPIGRLRNIGVEAAEGDYLRPFWDDDDCYPPHQLAHQMLYRAPGHLVMQTTQAIVLDVPQDIASVFLRQRPWGIENTALLPSAKLLTPTCRFDETMPHSEDVAFVRNWRARQRVLVQDNSRFPQSCTFVAVYHGRNASPRSRFLDDRDPAVFANQLLVSEEELVLINAALSPHSVKFQAPRKS